MEPEFVLALGFLGLFVCGLVSVPIWAFLATKFGKRNIWLSYNMYNALTTIAFVAVGRDDEYLFILLTSINGLALGGQFLIEVIMSDVRVFFILLFIYYYY